MKRYKNNKLIQKNTQQMKSTYHCKNQKLKYKNKTSNSTLIKIAFDGGKWCCKSKKKNFYNNIFESKLTIEYRPRVQQKNLRKNR